MAVPSSWHERHYDRLHRLLGLLPRSGRCSPLRLGLAVTGTMPGSVFAFRGDNYEAQDDLGIDIYLALATGCACDHVPGSSVAFLTSFLWPRHKQNRENILATIGAFSTTFPLLQIRRGRRLYRWRGFVDYRPTVKNFEYFLPTQPDIEELIGVRISQSRAKLVETMLLSRDCKIISVAGHRNFCVTDQPEIEFTQSSSLVSLVFPETSARDIALATRLMAPAALSGRPNMTTPCVGAHLLFKDDRGEECTETRFAYLDSKTGRINSFGTLQSSGICPFQLPVEHTDGIDALTNMLNRRR